MATHVLIASSLTPMSSAWDSLPLKTAQKLQLVGS